MKTKAPLTSRMSLRQLRNEGKDKTLIIQIMQGLCKIKRGNRSDIAKAAGLPEIQVWRRLSEMERKQYIERTGNVTWSNVTQRWQTEWQLPGTPKMNKK